MNSKLFRSRSLDRVNSPDQLNEYIKVANPSVWLTLAAIVILLLGVLVWSIFGVIETKILTCAVVSDSSTVCYIPEDDAGLLEKGMTFTVGSHTGTIISIADDPVPARSELSDYIMYQLGLDDNDYCYEAEIKINGLPNGVYVDQIVVERIHPISFVTQ